jgi:hypothetical protein
MDSMFLAVFLLMLRLSLSMFSLFYLNKIHVASLEIFVPEVHVIFFFLDFGDFAELVHVQLTDE